MPWPPGGDGFCSRWGAGGPRLCLHVMLPIIEPIRPVLRKHGGDARIELLTYGYRVPPLAPVSMLGFMLLAACGHAPAPQTVPRIDGLAVARSVALSQTTEAELRSKLGPPTRDGILHSDRIVSWIISEDHAVHYLAVLVDGRGVVTDLYWDIPTEVPWTPTSQCR